MSLPRLRSKKTKEGGFGGASNRILDQLPREEAEQLQGRMKLVNLKIREHFYREHEPIENVYFPVAGIASMVAMTRGGEGVEVATIGNEGMVGLPLFFRSKTSDMRALQQVSGASWRLSAEDFQTAINNSGELVNLLHRYAQALLTQIAQSTACNRLHDVEERCARWLMMTYDRVGPEFDLTHEFLAQMLGVRRATVTLVAGMMQKAGFITYRRGHILVQDVKSLEKASCECYHIIREEYQRLMPTRE